MHAVGMQKFIFGLYLFLLIFAPLAFGSVDYWSLAIVETGAAAGLLMWAVNRARSGERLLRVPGLVPLLFLLGWLILQLVPLPAGWVALVSPATHTAYQESVGALQTVGWMPMTLYPEATLAELLRLGGYILFYVLSVHLLLERKRLQTTVAVIVTYAAVLSFLAVFQRFNSNGRILWIRDIYEGGFFGPYINGNHMAGLLVMLLPLVLAMFILNRPVVRYHSLRATVVEFLTHPTLNTHMLLGLCGLTCIVAIFLSLARGGIVSASISLGLLGLGVMKITGNWRRGISIVAAAAVIILSVGWFGWEPIIQKFDRLADEQGHINLLRPVIWQDSLKIVADFPIFGTGLGSFQVIFPSYRSFADHLFFRHAHNDYVEFLVTGGVPFVILMGWFVAAVAVQTYRVYGRRREPYCRFLYIGAVAGLVGIGLHCFVEFNFQIGANGLYFFLLVSLLVAAAHTRLRATKRLLLLKPLSLKSNWALMLTAIAAVFCASSYAIGVGMADGFFADTLDTMTKDAITLKEHDIVESTLRPAAILAPLNHFYPFLRADAAAKAGLTRQAVSHYQSALRLSPTSALTMQELGGLLDGAGRPVPAEQLLKVAIRRAVQSPDGYSAYADWLIEKRRDKEGLDQMRVAMERDPKHARDYIDSLDLWGLSAADMAQAIPDLTEPCLAMAMYLQEISDDEGAEQYYRKAMWAESRSDKAHAGLFQRIYRHYFKQEDWQEALTVMQQAVDRLPDDPGLRISIARVYEKLGITYRASEEYQKALILRPGNLAAQDGLRRLAKQ